MLTGLQFFASLRDPFLKMVVGRSVFPPSGDLCSDEAQAKYMLQRICWTMLNVMDDVFNEAPRKQIWS